MDTRIENEKAFNLIKYYCEQIVDIMNDIKEKNMELEVMGFLFEMNKMYE